MHQENLTVYRRHRSLTAATGAIALSIGFLGGTPRCAAELVVNGSFETPVVTEGNGVHPIFGNDSSSLSGWTVVNVGTASTGSGVDLYRSTGSSGWQAADGFQSVDMNASRDGSIYQDLATVPGQTYLLSFDLAGNPDKPSDAMKQLEVVWDSNNFDLDFDTTGKSRSNMGWVGESFYLTANSSTTRVQFISLNTTDAGPVIDNVSVIVPEPSLIGIAGLAIPAIQRSRRKS